MQRIRVQTTQNVLIEYAPASLGDRILANLFDLLMLLVYFTTVSIVVSQRGFPDSTGFWAIVWLPSMLYHLISEIVMNGQTLGMKLMKTKVIRLDGAQPSLLNYLLRWLLRLVDVWIGFGSIGVVTIASSSRGQRLGDMAAGTAVISLRQRVNLADARLPTIEEGYAPVYLQAAVLSDRDVGIIREALQLYATGTASDPALLEALTHKVKELLRVEEPVAPLTFLRTVLRDHAYLTSHA